MDRLVAIAVSRRYLMVGLLAVVMIGGLIAFKQLNIEAYPDPTPPMVDVVTQSPGLSSEEIERYITIPIETQVAGIKNLRTIRTISLYGLSDVKLQFSFDYTYDEALQQVLNRLSQLAPLPGNVQPGISPLSAFQEKFRPAMTLKTRVVLVRLLGPGRSISYGRTFVTSGETKVATLCAGYGDGINRHLSGQETDVLIDGRRCRLLGRVTMDQVMVDVTHLDRVEPGDEVVLIGRQGDEEILASELASKAGTIAWEIFTGITKRVVRIYH